MSGMYLIIVLTGFMRSLYLNSYFEFPDLPVHLILHGIVLTMWFLIAVTQPLLVATDNMRVHKRLGILAIFIAGAVVIISLITLVIRDAPTIDEFPNRAEPNLYTLFAFSICVILGLKFRKKPTIHKRLMLYASMPLLAPALDRVARIPILNEFFGKIFFWFSGPAEIAFATLSFFALILSVVVFDLITIRRVHAGTLWGLGSIVIVALLATVAVNLTGAWAAFVRFVT